jgi:hypothetical protein
MPLQRKAIGRGQDRVRTALATCGQQKRSAFDFRRDSILAHPRNQPLTFSSSFSRERRPQL